MLSRTVVATLVGTLLLVTGCQDPASISAPTDSPAFAQVPATGNGSKLVFPVDEDLPSVECDAGVFLDVHQDGWVQVRAFDEPIKHNFELDVFHFITTFTNSAGETFVFRDAGPDHYYIEDGNLVVAATGRVGAGGLLGRIVINLTTGEVEFVAGKEFGTVDALACEALT